MQVSELESPSDAFHQCVQLRRVSKLPLLIWCELDSCVHSNRMGGDEWDAFMDQFPRLSSVASTLSSLSDAESNVALLKQRNLYSGGYIGWRLDASSGQVRKIVAEVYRAMENAAQREYAQGKAPCVCLGVPIEISIKAAYRLRKLEEWSVHGFRWRRGSAPEYEPSSEAQDSRDLDQLIEEAALRAGLDSVGEQLYHDTHTGLVRSHAWNHQIYQAHQDNLVQMLRNHQTFGLASRRHAREFISCSIPVDAVHIQTEIERDWRRVFQQMNEMPRRPLNPFGPTHTKEEVACLKWVHHCGHIK